MSKEALKLALEALEEINKLSIGENAICLPAEIDTAMDAIKEALEQPEPEPVAWTDENFTELAIDEDIAKDIGATVPLYTAPPKREPEPVIDKSAAIRIATSLGWTPQRKPLTDEEIENLWQNTSPYYDYQDFARAIEAAHGIKGEA